MVFGFVVVKFTMFVKQMSLVFQKPLPSDDYATMSNSPNKLNSKTT